MSLLDQIETDLGNTFFDTNDFAQVVTHTPKVGTAYTLPGIHSEPYLAVDVDSRMSVQSAMPELRVHVSKLQVAVSKGDKFTVNSVEFAVREYQPDGHGTARIMLWRS